MAAAEKLNKLTEAQKASNAMFILKCCGSSAEMRSMASLSPIHYWLSARNVKKENLRKRHEEEMAQWHGGQAA